MAFVGNGFDIQVMSEYGSALDTRYESFFFFLKLQNFDATNVVFAEMERLRAEEKKNWSDVEGVVADLQTAGSASARQLRKALGEIQEKFAEFLDLAVPSSLLVELGNESMSGGLAIESLSGFLADLEPAAYRQLSFPTRCDNFDLFNFVFVNFNYTSLLDNLVYLDQKQFDPLKYSTVDRNFSFRGNPKGVPDAIIRAGDTFSSYLMTEIIHPHGTQGVPRSLLFGVDQPGEVAGNWDDSLRLSKPFWGQNDKRYASLFETTELFIVFGCSIGKSDRWWWKSIAEVLGTARPYSDGSDSFEPELIIYWYQSAGENTSEDEVRRIFLEAAGKLDRLKDLERSIQVVLYTSSSDRTWLNVRSSSRV
ncbi:AbiH family protein [Mycetocola sp. JXN-3]|uniref:AbiH family protein n=1 Tax=Mycetocola sp. JXN-3 TaxID=2116510 RepID=UPI00165CEEA0|nr:AbiH family protein [Mycetocola sp. JXN-3]